jgi:hypothetical protein
MCISVQMEIRIVPNMIPDTFLGRENQSVRYAVYFSSASRLGLIANLDYQPLFMYHCLSYRSSEWLFIVDSLPFSFSSMVEYPSR